MNTGTYYLYEYENSKRRRNVGFIKVSRHYQSCILQLYARGIPIGSNTSIELYAFYCNDGNLYGTQIGTLNTHSRNISIRLSVSETHFPQSRPLMQIDGFLLKLSGSDLTLFWMASAFFFEINTQRFRLGEEPVSQAESLPDASGSGTSDSAASGSAISDLDASGSGTSAPAELTAAEKNPDSETYSADRTVAEPNPEALPTPGAETSADTVSDFDTEPEYILPPNFNAHRNPAPVNDMPDNAEPDSAIPDADMPDTAMPDTAAPDSSTDQADMEQSKVRKISRTDLSLLPRRFWHLANNSFLLHGYQNYNHLILIEEDGRNWLGVPGVYDLREARAADLFGFPKFSRSFAPLLDLAEEERNDRADFGYWCRCVGPCER